MGEQQRSLFDRPPLSRRGEPTSRVASTLMDRSAETLRRRVYEIVAAAGYRGVTGAEVVEALGADPWTVRPRLTELKLSGHVIKTLEARLGPRGTMQRVWKAAAR